MQSAGMERYLSRGSDGGTSDEGVRALSLKGSIL